MTIAQFTIDLMKTAIYWVNQEGIIEYANKSAYTSLAYHPLELIGLPISTIDPKINLSIWEKHWQHIKSNQTADLETEHFTKNGKSIPLKVNAYYAALDDKEYVILRTKDLTIASRYQQLFEVTEQVAKIGAWDWNLETNEVLNTKEIYRIYDLEPSDLLNPEIGFKGFNGEDLKLLEDAFQATREQKIPFDLTLNFKSVKGVKKVVYLSATPKIFNNKVIKIQGIMQDVTALKRLERHSYLKDMTIDTMGEMVFWTRLDGSFMFVNNSVIQNLGFSKEEFSKMHVWDIVLDYPREKWIANAAKLKEKGRGRFETIHQRKDGTTYPTDTELTYLQFQGKEYICAVVRNEEATKDYQERLKLIEFTIEQAGDMIFWLTDKGEYEYVNKKVCESYGYTEQELLKMSVYDLAKDFDAKDWKPLWESLQKQKHLVLLTTHYKKDGTPIDVEISANLIEYQGKSLCCSFVRDVTKKNKIEQQNQLTIQTINQAEDIILWTRLDGSLIYFNNAVQKQLGYTKEEFFNIKSGDLVANYQEEGKKAYRNKLETDNSFIGECVLIRKDGTQLIAELKSSVIEYQNEQINCSIFRDITNRKNRELELEKLLEENTALKDALQAENTYLNQELSLNHNFDDIISTSPKYKTILSSIEEVADTDATVLIHGETGTGKELLARAVHQLSNRSDQQLVKINCAALPENLIESELFGHERGAFTGAVTRKIGRFEIANNATLFLDEIGELPIDLQPKLLRVLQEGEFSRLGSNKTIKTDVRIIAATNRDLPLMVKEGTFREDLYYRLNVYPIKNIPLRERKEDIPLLVKYFLKKFNDRIGRNVTKVSARSLAKLQRYDYPGNIRELENVIERAVITSKAQTLDLSQWKTDTKKVPVKKKPFLTYEQMERQHLINALQKANWKVSGKGSAAELLGLNAKTLDSKMRKLKIKRKDFMIQEKDD